MKPKKTKRVQPFRKVRDDLFEDEQEAAEDMRQAPGGEDSLRSRPKSRGEQKSRFDMNPALQALETQEEMDAQTAEDLKNMQREFFGKPGGMSTEREFKPWESNQIDPFRDREPTAAELEEIERHRAEIEQAHLDAQTEKEREQEARWGITDKEIDEIENIEGAPQEDDDFTDDDLDVFVERKPPVKAPPVKAPSKSPEQVMDPDDFRSRSREHYDIHDPGRQLAF